MASLRKIVKTYQEELCVGNAWVILWRDGRSWQGKILQLELGSNLISFDDIWYLRHICDIDPSAIVLNGYYGCNFNKGYPFSSLVADVRWYHKNGMYPLKDFIKDHNPEIPTEQLDEARQIAHSAGLSFSERPYDGQDFNPYVYDGTMTPEDYELLQKIIEKNREDY